MIALTCTVNELAEMIYRDVFGGLKYTADDPTRQMNADVMGKVMKVIITERIRLCIGCATQQVVSEPNSHTI